MAAAAEGERNLSDEEAQDVLNKARDLWENDRDLSDVWPSYVKRAMKKARLLCIRPIGGRTGAASLAR